uniref:mirror-image polydactyly gene 1 protein n=1 Tax=Maylandia zebra TaxID=106582 RepID=UPI000D30D4D8|nr:mirror-image polydactyly gene 1 protein-like [Maylandia zebra]
MPIKNGSTQSSTSLHPLSRLADFTTMASPMSFWQLQRSGGVCVLLTDDSSETSTSVETMELQKVQMERDGALEDRRRLGAEVRALRANHRSQDLAPPSQPSLRADSVSPEAPPLMDKLQQLMKEKQSVEAELQRCQEAEREATEQVRRLERLVEVLRKKVGTGSVRAVI